MNYEHMSDDKDKKTCKFTFGGLLKVVLVIIFIVLILSFVKKYLNPAEPVKLSGGVCTISDIDMLTLTALQN